MELILGGICQGKTEYAKKKFSDYSFFQSPCVNEIAEIPAKKIIWDGFNFSIKKELKDKTASWIMDTIISIIENKDIVFVSDEVGNGIVPLDADERMYREFIGRVLIEIAKRSNHVTRILCGIPQVIK